MQAHLHVIFDLVLLSIERWTGILVMEPVIVVSDSRRRQKLLRLCALSAGFFGLPAYGADTIEVFDLGLTDIETYGGFAGIGLDGADRELFGEFALGFGIAAPVSGYLGATLSGSPRFTKAAPGLYMGLFGTPVDTRHFDFDLVLDFSGDASLAELALTPGIELNFDAAPDRMSWGFYFRANLPIWRTVGFEIIPGAYVTIAEGHQILLEYDMYLEGDDGLVTDIGGLALGYNVWVSEVVELISEVYVDVPMEDELVGVGVMVGFVASLPPPKIRGRRATEADSKHRFPV
ncbi:MAG: hypothetical protein HN348_16125, partial [Proteobacteria bacterium]|nr:hypothetical protein [Pseudomonadota bacterium]